VVEILSFSFWQAFGSAIHLATMRARFVSLSLQPGELPFLLESRWLVQVHSLAAQTEANAVGKVSVEGFHAPRALP
jgi:hypothetical protein